MGEEGFSVKEGVVVSGDFSLDVGEEHCGSGDWVASAVKDVFNSFIDGDGDVDFNSGEVRAV